MTFEFEGKRYLIEFQRDHRDVIRFDDIVQVEYTVKSDKPYTTVRIVETDPAKPLDRKVFRTATVGCWHKEPNFTHEKGRLRALALVTKALPVGMKRLMWDAYMHRTTKKG